MNRSAKRGLLPVVFVSLAGFAPSAFAYLDPSTGSMILSAILGIFATVGLAVKTYWYKLKGMLRKSDGESAEPAAAPDPDGSE
jgi:hypothetical protein